MTTAAAERSPAGPARLAPFVARRGWLWSLAAALLLAAGPAPAQIVVGSPWRLVPPGEVRHVARSSLAVTAAGPWNRATRRPTSRSEVWTRDGLTLGELSFFVIPAGKPLFRERDKKRDPLPRFDPAMLPTDIVEWFESSARIVTGGALFDTSDVRPATLAGVAGVEFRYSYASQADNLERLGMARAAVIGGSLYLITFDAPRLHYFDANEGDVRAIMDSARLASR